MKTKDGYDLTTRMRAIEDANPTPPPEEFKAQQEKCLGLLTAKNALDVAPILGLA